jgi:polypeptide N-acetylgalactosaminyltransferase
LFSVSRTNTLDTFWIGEYGTPVNVDKEKLSAEEREKYDAGWENNAFNEYASDFISLHRSLIDFRDEECV